MKKVLILGMIFLVGLLVICGMGMYNFAAMGEAASENPWSLGVVFYDSTVNGGLTPLTDIEWDASDGSYQTGQTRVITMQITYRNTAMEQDYEPGDLSISIPNLVYNSLGSYANKPNWLVNKIIVGANDSTHVGYDWDFVTASNPSVGQKDFTFKNAEAMEAGSNFEGSIQIVYEIQPNTENPEKYEDSCTHGYTYAGHAVLEAGEDQDPVVSNEIILDYTRTYEHPWKRAEHRIDKSAEQVKNPGELGGEGAEDYYWVKYTFTYDEPSTADRYPWIFARNYYVSDYFPGSCLVYNRQGEQMTPSEDGEYIIRENDNSGSYVYVSQWQTSAYRNRTKVCYVAYPKSEYNQENGNLQISNAASLWGTYADRDEPEQLADDTVDLNLNEYEFQYPPGHYDIYKGKDNTQMRYQNIVSEGIDRQYNYTTWRIKPTAGYSGRKMDVEFGDDVLYYLNDENTYVRIRDEDYCFRRITLSTSGSSDTTGYWVNESGTEIPRGKYDVELYVRYAGSSSYTLYDTFKNREKGTWNFSKEDKVVGYYFVIKDMTESLNPSSNSSNFSTGLTEFYMQDIPQSGTLYNFDYIKVYLDDGTGEKHYVNEPGLDSYATYATQADIAAFDQETYGEYRMRDRNSNNWIFYQPTLFAQHSIGKDVSAITQNELLECFNGIYTIRPRIYTVTQFQQQYQEFYRPQDQVSFIGAYDLLPKGVELDCTAEDILQSYVLSYDSKLMIFDSDFQPVSEEKLRSVIQERLDVRVTHNWNGTGRTHIAIRCNLEDYPIYVFTRGNAWTPFYLSFNVPFIITYDSYLEYGNTYVNRAYCEALYQDNRRCISYSGSNSDNGSTDREEMDINESGKIEDQFSRYSRQITITSVVSTHQSLEKTVMTPETGRYVSRQANAEVGGEYSYRIRVRTGRADVTNLIVYDNVERYIRTDDGFTATSGENEYWQGSLLRVDTSHPESKGYTVRVWWSGSEQPGKPGEDDSWQLYTDSTDNSSVRTLAFEYLDSEGNPAVLPAESTSYLYLRMKAPSVGYETKLAYNGSYSDWTALDSFGNPVDFITGINSNIVRVSLTDTTTLSVRKNWLGDGETQRPESISVQLLCNETAYGSAAELNADNEWKYTFADLPKYNDNGELYKYTVQETPVQGYYCYPVQEGEQVTLTNVPATSVSVRKIWIDNNNHYETRPEQIVFQLCQTVNGVTTEVEGKTVTLEGDGEEWTGAVSGLPALTAHGDAITYSFIEKNVPRGYAAEVSGDGLTITNTATGKVSVPVSKKWIGAAAESITVELLADGVKTAEAVLTAEGGWEYTFADLEQFSNGVEIEYTIREVGIDGYMSEISGDPDGYIITNINQETVDIPVEKRWIGPKVSNVTVLLLADGVEKETAILNEENQWKYTFEKLRKYDSQSGNEIAYTIKEAEVDAYESEVSGTAAEGFVITNTNLETVEVTGTKTWEDNGLSHDNAAEIELTLQRTTGKSDALPEDVEAIPSWEGDRYTFKELPKYDAEGYEYEYIVSERQVNGYGIPEQNGYDFINRLVTPTPTPEPTPEPSPEPTPEPTPETTAPPKNTFHFYFTKEWIGGNEGEIDFTFYLPDGTPYRHKFHRKKINDSTWMYECWLSRGGDYYVIEKPIDGYQVKYINPDTHPDATDRCYNGGNIVNYKVPKTGDDTAFETIIAISCISGVLLILLFAWIWKRDHRKTDDDENNINMDE